MTHIVSNTSGTTCLPSGINKSTPLFADTINFCRASLITEKDQKEPERTKKDRKGPKRTGKDAKKGQKEAILSRKEPHY